MQRLKVSSGFQVALPAAAWRRLGRAAGDRLMVNVPDGSLLLVLEPDDYAAALLGLHEDVWEGIDPQGYVRAERDAWPR